MLNSTEAVEDARKEFREARAIYSAECSEIALGCATITASESAKKFHTAKRVFLAKLRQFSPCPTIEFLAELNNKQWKNSQQSTKQTELRRTKRMKQTTTKCYWDFSEQEKRTVVVNALQNLVDFLRDNPEVPIPQYHSIWNYDCTKEQIAAVAKAASHAEKSATDSSFRLTVPFDSYDAVNLYFIAERDKICTKKQVGTKVVPAVESRTIVYAAVPEHEVPVYEWDCPSLLAQESEEPAALEEPDTKHWDVIEEGANESF